MPVVAVSCSAGGLEGLGAYLIETHHGGMQLFV